MLILKWSSNNSKYVKLATVVVGDQKAPFSIAATLRCRGGHYYFLWIAPLYPWYVPYVKQGGIKYHVFGITWPGMGEHSTH